MGEVSAAPRGKPSPHPRAPHGKRPWEERGGGRAGEVGRDLAPLLKYREIANAAVPWVSLPPREPQLSAPWALEGPGRPRGWSPAAPGGWLGFLGLLLSPTRVGRGEFGYKPSRATCGEGEVSCVCPPPGLQPLLFITGMLQHVLPLSAGTRSSPHSFLSRAAGMKKPKALPVLDRAFGRDLHPKPVGDPPKRLLGGKSPEPYSGTYGG